MAEKLITVRLHYDGILKTSTYYGGKTIGVNAVDSAEFSYTVLMEYVKDYLHLSEIGGVYIQDDGAGWKLLTRDKELIDLVNGCENEEEIHLFVDTIIDKEIEPTAQMQPHVIIRPRKDIVEGIQIYFDK